MHRLIIVAVLIAAGLPAQGVVAINPSKDNTLFQSTTGNLSDGAGPGIFCGLTATNRKRRALLAFDVAGSLPAGATVLGAKLVLDMNQTNPFVGGPLAVDVRRLAADWGEGSSVSTGGAGGGGSGGPPTAGDATWLHRFHPSAFWAAAGGDFLGVSATTTVGAIGIYTWSSAQLASDVQDMLDNPASNFGWMLKSPETLAGDAKRFASREEPVVASRPRLEITYLAAPTASVTDLGYGCGGFALAPSGLPTVGNPAFALSASGGTPGAAAYVFAAGSVAAAPLDLGGGCQFWLDVPSAVAYANSGVSLGPVTVDGSGAAFLACPIPSNPAIHGFTIVVEGAALATAWTATNVLVLVIGT
jgi:hypothetical protein